jgi:L-ascorbate metabolism protein UlaG (beta-lactamase superfamily)
VRTTPVPSAISEKIEGEAASLQVRRIGHASVLLEAGELRVLTDPWVTETSAYNIGEPLGMSVDALPKLSAVIASHGHYDHFDVVGFAQYRDKSVPMIVRPEMVKAAKDAGFTDVRPLNHWESVDVNGIKITATPASHGVEESTYVVEMGGFTVFFGGDTRMIPELKEIPKKFPNVDLALLSVNGLSVTGAGQMVMNDDEAAQVAKLLNAKIAVPMHYRFHGNWFTDTFILSYHGTPEGFVAAAKKHAPSTKVHVLETGAPLIIEKATVVP